jgi:hypothetical protein
MRHTFEFLARCPNAWLQVAMFQSHSADTMSSLKPHELIDLTDPGDEVPAVSPLPILSTASGRSADDSIELLSDDDNLATSAHPSMVHNRPPRDPGMMKVTSTRTPLAPRDTNTITPADKGAPSSWTAPTESVKPPAVHRYASPSAPHVTRAAIVASTKVAAAAAVTEELGHVDFVIQRSSFLASPPLAEDEELRLEREPSNAVSPHRRISCSLCYRFLIFVPSNATERSSGSYSLWDHRRDSNADQ